MAHLVRKPSKLEMLMSIIFCTNSHCCKAFCKLRCCSSLFVISSFIVWRAVGVILPPSCSFTGKKIKTEGKKRGKRNKNTQGNNSKKKRGGAYGRDEPAERHERRCCGFTGEVRAVTPSAPSQQHSSEFLLFHQGVFG